MITAIPAAIQARRMGWSVAPALLAPLFWVVVPLAFARSAALALRRGGIRWRDTFYPLEELRRGRIGGRI